MERWKQKDQQSTDEDSASEIPLADNDPEVIVIEDDEDSDDRDLNRWKSADFESLDFGSTKNDEDWISGKMSKQLSIDPDFEQDEVKEKAALIAQVINNINADYILSRPFYLGEIYEIATMTLALSHVPDTADPAYSRHPCGHLKVAGCIHQQK